MDRASIDGVLDRVVRRLSAAGYRKKYTDEVAFELDVWPRMTGLAEQIGFDCLTSHAVHSDRSVENWERFSHELRGSDVWVLGAKNRLDIVLRKRSVGSIGIEVKCLGPTGHTRKLTQGLGQTVLGLANRDRAVLLIHCGKATERHRADLREVGTRICAGSRIRLVVVP